MKFLPLLSLLLFLVETTFSLQALPMLERGERAGAAQQEEAGRRLSERQPSITETDSIDSINNSSSSAAATTAVVAGAEPTDEAAEAARADFVGSLGGRSVAAVPAKAQPRYRLGPDDKWEEQHPETGEWKPTDRFEDTTATWRSAGPIENPQELEAFQFVTLHYNRAGDISKRIEAYQQELSEKQAKNPSSERDNRIFVLEHLIPVLNKARDYQNAMITKLAEQVPSSDSRIALLEDSYRLSSNSRINESPNKIEMIADQIEREHHALTSIQIFANVVQQRIDDIMRVGEAIPQYLGVAREELNEAKTHQQGVIEATSDYAQCLKPPFQIDKATQARMGEHLRNCRDKKDIAEKKTIWASSRISQYQDIVREISIQRNALAVEQREREEGRPQPRQPVIDLLTRSVEVYQQAAAENNSSKAARLSDAGNALYSAALEAQRLQPREQVIAFLTRSAELRQQGAAENNPLKANLLRLVGEALSWAASEAQQLQPREQLIDLLTRSAALRQQAAAENDLTRASYLHSAAAALDKAAQEAERLQPRQQVIDLLTRSAELFKKAAAENIPFLARCLNTEGNALYREALEAQQLQPRQQVIDRPLREARENEDRATSILSSCTIS